MIRKKEVPAFVVRRRLKAQWKALAEMERQAAEMRERAALAKARHDAVTRSLRWVR